MTKQMSDYELKWKKRNMRFLMILGPLTVVASTFLAIHDQYQINLKAINEGRSVGFQFGFISPIVMGLSFWIIALLCKCQILENRVALLEEKQKTSSN